MTRRASAPCAALLGALVGAATSMAGLVRLGSGELATPPLRSWAALTQWYESTAPAVALIATARSVAVVLAGWLLVGTTLQLLGSLPALRPLGQLADLLSPRSLQRLGHGLAGLSLTAGLAAAVPGAGTPIGTAVGAAPVAVPGDDPPTGSTAAGTATIRLVEEASPEGGPHEEVTVAAGDSFWSIAVDTLTERVGGRPTDREVAPYWRRLVEQNRANLVDPSNPDLIFPGQVVTLPPS